jgi:pyruvate/2-oxoglutarate dehydrogenase complex dihydrolipoamide dehydrogenase (E3) component
MGCEGRTVGQRPRSLGRRRRDGRAEATHIALMTSCDPRHINGGNHVTTGRQVPFCLFTDPELARVGCRKRRGEGFRTACSRSRWKQCFGRARFRDTGFLKLW